MLSRTPPVRGIDFASLDTDGDGVLESYDASVSTVTAYDSVGNVESITDPLGNATWFGYDAYNRQIWATDALGSTAEDEAHTTHTTYDLAGNIETVTGVLDRTTSYEYDALNRQTRVTLPTVDVYGQVNPVQPTMETAYDLNGNVYAVTDAAGVVTEYRYDALGRLTREILPDAAEADGDDGNSANNPTTSFYYDALGNLSCTEDAVGNRTWYVYDELGRQLAVIDALVASADVDSDGDNVVDAAAWSTRPASATDHAVTTYYDAAGNVVRIVDQLGNSTWFFYDALGRQTESVDALAADSSVDTDADGLPDAVPSEHVTATTYDAVGNMQTITDAEGNTTTYTYDAINRVRTEADALSNTRTYDEYDEAGNLRFYQDGSGRYIEYVYDELNRQTHEYWRGLTKTSAIERTIEWSYDAAGRLEWVTDTDVATSTQLSKYTYTYDDHDRVDTVSNDGTANAPTVMLTYTYDEHGHVRTVSDGTAVTEYLYDSHQRVAHIMESGTGVAEKRVDYAYDDLGRYTSITRYADLAGTQLVAATTYDDPSTATQPGYDELGQLRELVHTVGAAALAYTWTYDNAGRMTAMTSPGGATDYTLDDTGQLVDADHSAGFQADESYTYDANGNRDGGGDTVDTDNRLTSDGVYNYAYDDEGNLAERTRISDGSKTVYTWDHRNRLMQVTFEDDLGVAIGIVSYVYDAFDRRIATQVDADASGTAESSTHYVYDGDALVQEYVDADGPSGGGAASLAHRFLHGPGVDDVLAQEDAAGEVLWSLTDHQGSVRHVVKMNSGTPAIVENLVYDSFGQLVEVTDGAGSPLSGSAFHFSYTGREWDALTGLYYYRARWYDASTGRFLSEDPAGFGAGDANLYRYVANSPMTLTDPSGLCWSGSGSSGYSSFGTGVGYDLSISSTGITSPFTDSYSNPTSSTAFSGTGSNRSVTDSVNFLSTSDPLYGYFNGGSQGSGYGSVLSSGSGTSLANMEWGYPEYVYGRGTVTEMRIDGGIH